MLRLAGLLILTTSAFAASAPDAADGITLLRRFDLLRNGAAWSSFAVRIQITNYEDGQEDEEHLFLVYQKGTEKSYVEFLSPREKGRHLLMLGDDMWIYLPDTSRPIRITPLERLAGNAANGDVARANWATDYNPVSVRSERVDGVECYVLDLSAKRKGATYRRVLLWLRLSDNLPVKADFFVAAGRQLKSATYDSYQQIDGQTMLRRMTIYDRVRQNSRTVIDYLSFQPRALPDRIFHQGRSETF
jgi:outer membrane lipoprotein-sorting protein